MSVIAPMRFKSCDSVRSLRRCQCYRWRILQERSVGFPKLVKWLDERRDGRGRVGSTATDEAVAASL
ncbi:hypothetical protein BDR22DRAFT_862163 [Usnea florida]